MPPSLRRASKTLASILHLSNAPSDAVRRSSITTADATQESRRRSGRRATLPCSFGSLSEDILGDCASCPSFLEDKDVIKALRPVLREYLDSLSDDALIKIFRQLEICYVHGVKRCSEEEASSDDEKMSAEEFAKLCQGLCHQSVWLKGDKNKVERTPSDDAAAAVMLRSYCKDSMSA